MEQTGHLFTHVLCNPSAKNNPAPSFLILSKNKRILIPDNFWESHLIIPYRKKEKNFPL